MVINMDRPAIEALLINQMAVLLKQDQHAAFKTMLANLSDFEFWQMIAEIRQDVPKSPSVREYISLVEKAREAVGVSINNTALKNIPVSFLPEPNNALLLKRIAQSSPSDIIRLTGESDRRLMALWEDSNKTQVKNGEVTIPSDLFFAETIPLMDCRIVVDETGEGETGCTTAYRVVIFGGYGEKLKNAGENDIVEVGAVFLDPHPQTKAAIVVPICAARGVDKIMGGRLGYLNMSEKCREETIKKISVQEISQMVVALLETWYGIQIALLHPMVRDLFKKPRVVLDHQDRKPDKGHKKRKVRYIKQHSLNDEELENTIYGDTRTFTRRALIWYVIGHWRTYADGRKVFVQPYWKGALRNIKTDVPDREREIAQISGVGLPEGGAICET